VAFGLLARAINRHWGLIPASLLALALNGLVGPLMLGMFGIVPMALAKAVVPILAFASALNLAIASAGIVVYAKRAQKPTGTASTH
jgi:hypothetical protein